MCLNRVFSYSHAILNTLAGFELGLSEQKANMPATWPPHRFNYPVIFLWKILLFGYQHPMPWLAQICLTIISSATRWLNYFSIFGHLLQPKFAAPSIKHVGSNFCQILLGKLTLKNCQRLWNFRLSDEILANLGPVP